MAVASVAPPAPVWNEKPSRRSPEFWMTRAAVCAMTRATGLRVMRVVPDTIPAGSPMASICTT